METDNVIAECIDNCITVALDELYAKDLHLFTYRVHERAIVFRFGHYLQNQMDLYDVFRQYNLDFEYNRNGRQPKRIPARSRNGAVPDLIIHRRGVNTHNLLVLEFKPYWGRNASDDCEKILQFLNPDWEYKYQYGKSIILAEDREDVTIKSFSQAQVYPERRL